MATDYNKKTVSELQEVLKSRNLSHTGKKAELVARLTHDDEGKSRAGEGATSAEQATADPGKKKICHGFCWNDMMKAS